MAMPDPHSEEQLVADVRIEMYGSIFLFWLLSDTAAWWVEENVDETRMFFAGALVVEHCYAADLARGMIQDGLAVV